MSAPKLKSVQWEQSHRIIPSRYPPIDLFERVTDDPAQWEILAELEGLTNDRLRDELGELRMVDPSERISGPGASAIMAAFTHTGFSSRFTDGSYGVYYAASSIECAIEESRYHRARLLKLENTPPCEVQMREYTAAIDARLHNLCPPKWSTVHHPTDYTASQRLAKKLRTQGSIGLLYRSVRAPEHRCVAAFRTTAFTRSKSRTWASQGRHYRYLWDGQKIRVMQISEIESLPILKP